MDQRRTGIEVSLLLRLRLIALEPGAAPADRAALERFRRFRALVEREHRRWHLVQQYAKHLGCSTKSLNRAARTVSGTTAKGFIADRVVLEAKRLSVHTAEPVFAIAADLGFEEATNFVKFPAPDRAHAWGLSSATWRPLSPEARAPSAIGGRFRGRRPASPQDRDGIGWAAGCCSGRGCRASPPRPGPACGPRPPGDP